MQKWEYSSLVVPAEKYDEYIELMNIVGLEGWEFTGHSVDAMYSMNYIMKRPIVVEERVSHFLLFGRGTPLCEKPEWTGWVVLEDKIHDVCPKCRSLKPNMSGL